MDGAPPSPKTNRDHLMKDNLGCYCPKTFEMAKTKKQGGATWRSPIHQAPHAGIVLRSSLIHTA